MTSSEHHFGDFRLDPVNQCLWRGTAQISLSPKAFAVLHYMVKRPGRLVTKQELLDALWHDTFVTEGVLKRAVLEIRKVLNDPVDEPRFIHTLHRRGYRFLAAAKDAAPPPETGELTGIVGRSRESRQLDAWFEEMSHSRRQVVFLPGEAGLAKSTLVDSWMASAPRRARRRRTESAACRSSAAESPISRCSRRSTN